MKRPIPSHVKAKLKDLRKYANGLRGRYGVPVYLTGSALQGLNHDPRDWDIRLQLPEADFVRMFRITGKQWEREGITGEWTDGRWRWSDECVKQSKLAARMCGLNVDFQVYPLWYARRYYGKNPRLRLDTRRPR